MVESFLGELLIDRTPIDVQFLNLREARDKAREKEAELVSKGVEPVDYRLTTNIHRDSPEEIFEDWRENGITLGLATGVRGTGIEVYNDGNTFSIPRDEQLHEESLEKVLEGDVKAHGIHDVADVAVHTTNQEDVEHDIYEVVDVLGDSGHDVYNFSTMTDTSAFSVVDTARELKNSTPQIWINLEMIEGAGEPTIYYRGGELGVGVEDYPEVPDASPEGAMESEQELYEILDDAGIPVEEPHDDQYDQL